MMFLMLPDELVLNCLARVSRLYHPTLSLVSKRIRSIVNSLELYKTRSLLGCTETCLYVCIEFTPAPRWFFLSRRPSQATNPGRFTPCFHPCFSKKEKPSDNVLVSVQPRSNSLHVHRGGLIAAGCNIYRVGGQYGSKFSSAWFMDCRTHTWCEAPSMREARLRPSRNILDGKIYVAGGSKQCDPSNWIELFDPKTQTWEHVPSPDTKIHPKHISNSLVIQGKLYLYGEKNVVYEPKENRWEKGCWKKPLSCITTSCVIDNVLFCYGWSGKLEWYDFKKGSWRVLEGLEELLLPRSSSCVTLVDYGGKIAVFGEKDNKEIWCAEISLERRNGQEIRGKVEWCDVVLKVPTSCESLKVFAVTV